MTQEEIHRIIKKGEGVTIEFKKASTTLPKNFFDTVCAFLNRDGGSILLGVDDDGTIIGINKNCIVDICKSISNLSNNIEKLSPAFLLQPEIVEIGDKSIAHIFVPASSQVHKVDNKIFDRSSDGDYVLKTNAEITAMYIRKSGLYSENRIYPYLQYRHFDEHTIQKAKNLIRNNRPAHPWLALSDTDFFKASGLYRYDITTNQEGFTLASLMLFGKEEIIQSALPYYKIDALLKIDDLNRYDDRITTKGNLIDSYYALMDFVSKNLPDKFYLEGDQRISVREKLFREVVANFLIHREYANPYPSLLTITKENLIAENANRPLRIEHITLANCQPFPKNPHIAQMFVQMGYAETLGSGIRNIYKYSKLYTNKEPDITDDNIYKISIPIPEDKGTSNDGILNGILNGTLNEKQQIVYNYIKENSGANATKIAENLAIPRDTLNKILASLIEMGMIGRRGGKKFGGFFANSKSNDGTLNGTLNGILNDTLNGTLNGTLNDTLNGTLNGTLNEKQQLTYNYIKENSGANATKIAENLAIPRDTLNKILASLIEMGMIGRRGGKKFGGFFANSKSNDGTLNGILNDTLNGTLNEKQQLTYNYIKENSGANATKIAENLAIPRDTLNKILASLIELRMIERRGGKKFGGFFANSKSNDGTLNGILNDTLNGTLNGTLNEKQQLTYNYIKENSGANATKIAENLAIPRDTLNKILASLIEMGMIERRGGKKFGGYHPLNGTGGHSIGISIQLLD